MKQIRKIFPIVIFITIVTIIQSCLLGDTDEINVVCNSDCTIIQGRFTTEDGNTPIKDAELKFNWGTQPSPGGGGSKTRKIAATHTDEAGNYRIKFYAKDEELTEGSFSVQFKVPDNSYIIQEDYSYFEIFGVNKRDTLITRNYHVAKKGATLIIKIKNPQDIIGDDQLICSVSYKFGVSKSFYFGIGELFSNNSSEATFNTAANQFSYIQIARKINGQYFNSLDSVIVSVNETKVYDVLF